MCSVAWSSLTLAEVSPSLPSANEAMADYDALSQLPSQKLIDDGRRHFEQRRAAKALACFTIVSDRYQEGMNDEEARLCIRALNNLGCVYKFSYFDYAQAYDCFIRALDLCEALAYSDFLPVVLVNLGDLLNDYGISYVSQPMVQQARQIFEQCIDEATANGNWEAVTTAFFNLANQNYDLDLSKYTILFSDSIPSQTPDLQYVRLQYRGLEHLQHKRYDEARQCFIDQLAAVNTRWEPERDTLAALMSIAHTYNEQQDFAHSIEYLDRALHMAEDYDIDDLAAGICELIAENYRLIGDSTGHRYFYVRYLEKKEAASNSRLASIAELNYVHQLKKEQQAARDMKQRQQQERLAFAAVALVLLVVIASAYLLWRKNRELTARNKSLFDLTQQVIKAEDEQQKLRSSHQSSEDRESLIRRIQDVLDSPDLICQQDFTVARLAALVESNTTYVSQAINQHYGMAFSNVLGNCRVREACRRMNDHNNYGNYTVEGFATSVGFKSRTAFVNAFKREVGLTPSEYLRMALQGGEELGVRSFVTRC